MVMVIHTKTSIMLLDKLHECRILAKKIYPVHEKLITLIEASVIEASRLNEDDPKSIFV